MAAKLASGPQGAKATLYDTIRNTLTTARDDAALKAPVRRSAQQALTWLDNADFQALQGTTASGQVLRTVHNLRSVLSSVAGGYEDTNRHELAVEARAEARRLAKRFGIEVPAPSDQAMQKAVTAIAGMANRGPGR